MISNHHSHTILLVDQGWAIKFLLWCFHPPLVGCVELTMDTHSGGCWMVMRWFREAPSRSWNVNSILMVILQKSSELSFTLCLQPMLILQRLLQENMARLTALSFVKGHHRSQWYYVLYWADHRNQQTTSLIWQKKSLDIKYQSTALIRSWAIAFWEFRSRSKEDHGFVFFSE